MRVCETVEAVFISHDAEVARVTMPAFTREREDFLLRVAAVTYAYVEASERSGDGMSLGDFAMWCATRAALEPRTMEGSRA